MTTSRIAFIGLGQISGSHFHGVQRLNAHVGRPVLEISAVTDPQPGRAEAWVSQHFASGEARPKIVGSYRDLLAGPDRPDAVSILVPHHLHLEVARPFLEAGIAVQMQKPIGLAIRDSREIIALARKHQTALVVSEPSILGRQCRRVVEWIRSGVQLGTPTLLFDQAVIDLRGGYFMTPWRHLKGMAGAGWFIDHGVHQTHWMLETLGPCQSAMAYTRQIEPSRQDARWGEVKVDTEDLAVAVLRFKSGAIVQFSVVSGGQGQDHRVMLLYGTKGSWNGKFTPGGSKEAQEPAYPAADPAIPEDSFGHSYAELLSRMQQWDKPVVGSPERALEAEAIIYACLESAHTGGEVAVQDIIDGKKDAYEQTVWEACQEVAALPMEKLT
jgi:UDP-N-acetyl-2-amino-2-deoxyglucuronate dehydrogenase